MAARTPEPEKRPGFFKQIKMLISFVKEEFPWIPWLLVGIVLVGAGIGVLLGFLIPPFQVWTLVIWIISGIMLGLLGAMIVLNRLTPSAVYRKVKGRPGGVGQSLDVGLRRAWTRSPEPVAVNPKTQDAVYRAVGKGGIVLVGEGQRARLTRLVREEKLKADRVAHGVPVHVFYEGDGEGDVPMDQLVKTIHQLPKKVDRNTRAAIVQRLDSMKQGLGSLPIPKGIDPNRVRAQRPR